MSWNDRCGETADIIRHGGTIDGTDPALREALQDWCEQGREGWGASPPRSVIDAIRFHPDNAELLEKAKRGELDE